MASEPTTENTDERASETHAEDAGPAMTEQANVSAASDGAGESEQPGESEVASAPAPKKAGKASKSKGRSTGKVAPPDRNPANEKETWTGRGRQPRWVVAEIANGRKLEDLLIK